MAEPNSRRGATEAKMVVTGLEAEFLAYLRAGHLIIQCSRSIGQQLFIVVTCPSAAK